MYNVRMLPLMAALSLALGGCSYLTGKSGYFRDESEDYTTEKAYDRLSFPKGMKPREMPDYLRIPRRVAKSGKVGGDVPRPDQRVMRTTDGSYSVRRDGNQRWLLVEKSPDRIWPQLVRFWDVSNMPLSVTNEKQGVMETRWTMTRNKTGKMSLVHRLFGGSSGAALQEERFRLTVKPGADAGTSEIRLQHAVRVPGSKEEAVWQHGGESGTNTGPELEASLLNEILIFLVQNVDDQSAPRITRTLSTDNQNELIFDGNGNPVLKISQPFARSWQAVSVALDKAGIHVVDKNRSVGVFYIDLDDDEMDKDDGNRKGFLGSCFGSNADHEQTPRVVYRVRISPIGEKVYVTLEKDINTLPPVDVSKKVLQSIKSHLG